MTRDTEISREKTHMINHNTATLQSGTIDTNLCCFISDIYLYYIRTSYVTLSFSYVTKCKTKFFTGSTRLNSTTNIY